MNNLLSYSFIFMIIITIIISIMGAGNLDDYTLFDINPEDIYVSHKGFTWPIPNKYYISSYFGYRDLNIIGSGPYHSGIDIPGSEGTYFLATMPRHYNLYWI